MRMRIARLEHELRKRGAEDPLWVFVAYDQDHPGRCWMTRPWSQALTESDLEILEGLREAGLIRVYRYNYLLDDDPDFLAQTGPKRAPGEGASVNG